MNIYEYFKDLELACPCCGTLSVHQRSLHRLYRARLQLGQPMFLNSACRCRAHNTSVGGADHSSHLCTDTHQCNGFDICARTASYRYELIRALMCAGFSRIIVHPTYVHADDDPGRALCENILIVEGA